MIRRPPRSTHCISSAASDVYKRQNQFYVLIKVAFNTSFNQSKHLLQSNFINLFYFQSFRVNFCIYLKRLFEQQLMSQTITQYNSYNSLWFIWLLHFFFLQM
eukprot:TRINITY_DN6821_c0_g1_i1.p1 TRINITY_DN6821_c0_g1~~TRINITY_DN6821_c0_g1_i1.p1  ORF type:complete len:102 (-),score=17.52 TRINITY_DN6821_c0_g1_i1:271-576(-)